MIARNPAGPMLTTPDAFSMAGDLTRTDVREAFIRATIDRFGAIDVLVNNAGVGLYAGAAESCPDHVRYMFELNTFVPLELVQLALPHMRRQGRGAIVNIGSVAALVSLPWATVYCATKASLDRLSEGLRRELAAEGISVSVVKPCVVKTTFREHVLGGRPPQRVGGIRSLIAPEAVASRVVATAARGWRARTVPAWQFHSFVMVERWFPWIMDAYLDWKAH
jgi:short-subunit dehydrogenase